MTRWTFSLLLVVLSFTITNGQSRTELENRRKALLRQIEQNKKLLAQTEKESGQVLKQANALNVQISLRQELLNTMTREINGLSGTIENSERKLNDLRASQSDLIAKHAAQLKSTYIQKKIENPMVFLFSSASLNEAVARWQFMQAVGRSRKRTIQKVTAQRDSIAFQIDRLRELRSDKQSLAENTVEQERELVQEKKTAEAQLSEFRKREKEIRSTIDVQLRESEKLAREIERIIEAEVAKSAAPSALPNAPALAALTSEFSGNKGKLPWPVDQGIITGKFGDQPHPVIKSIKISNNGIDFTAPAGERVQAIFNGEVVGKKVIPGFDYMIIIKHGSFYTVYSRLKRTSIEIGDKVRTGQWIGALADDDGQNAQLHLEIWKNKQKLNPEAWIAR